MTDKTRTYGPHEWHRGEMCFDSGEIVLQTLTIREGHA